MDIFKSIIVWMIGFSFVIVTFPLTLLSGSLLLRSIRQSTHSLVPDVPESYIIILDTNLENSD